MTKQQGYQPRAYRDSMGSDRWRSFHAGYLETDLWIAVSAGSYKPSVEKFAVGRIIYYRDILDSHIGECPDFLTSLEPIPEIGSIHPLLLDMYKASQRAGTGPMSAVAGAIAEYIVNDLVSEYGFDEVIVENGGDLFLKIVQDGIVSVYAGGSPLSGKIGLVVSPVYSPLSICCSSGTVGHSLSFGSADACVIVCRSGAQADAYATACCNAVKDIGQVQPVTDLFLEKPDVISVVIIKDDKVGLGGDLEVTFL